MVYYRDNELMIRNMEEADARIFTDKEIEQGWHTDISKYMARLQDQSVGKCISLTAVYKGLPVGYVNVYLTGLSGAFSEKGFPEIVDFGVLEKYRRNGIGSTSVHGIFQARILEWVAIFLLQGIFLTQGSNLCLLRVLHWQGGSLLSAPPDCKQPTSV